MELNQQAFKIEKDWRQLPESFTHWLLDPLCGHLSLKEGHSLPFKWFSVIEWGALFIKIIPRPVQSLPAFDYSIYLLTFCMSLCSLPSYTSVLH